ncbi:Uu.00g061810.m01.CDS01 [Anthostomella pinea]|uniref:Uu.00g061810.m01.CDS01 n=1 Tax=Anthostomella pinea TaxID=933095 RepID=A0AAI8VSK1_9PEZI|nr:Uu.00g061810.m01.CDS01 [Anthostomella pinea]
MLSTRPCSSHGFGFHAIIKRAALASCTQPKTPPAVTARSYGLRPDTAPSTRAPGQRRPKFINSTASPDSKPQLLWNNSQHTTSRVSGSPNGTMYTASFAFFEAIWEAGITHCFVNLGSDHPSIIEAIVKGQRENRESFPRIITCPNEMVAMSMADGYARLTGKPQCVIVHVDVGTQGLGAAVHNASTGRAPVLVFAGLSPFTLEGEMRGSRTEYIHWIQNVPDQTQIVGQYCRYAAEIKTGKNIKQMVNRALQFATSGPQGPVYLVGAREVMEEDIEPYSLEQGDWNSVELGGLTPKASKAIAEALLGAENPLIVTGFAGRNHKIPGALVELANAVKGLRVLDTGGSDMCFPASHPSWLGLRFGVEPIIEQADVIVVLDCDVPWIPTQCKPRKDAKIFHVDVDPLKQMMPLFYVPAQHRYRADALTAVEQLAFDAKNMAGSADSGVSAKKWEALEASHKERLDTIGSKTNPAADGSFGVGYLCKSLRSLCPDDTIWAIEAVTNTGFVHDNIQPELPGSWINCGGGGLGWSGGGALGIKLATDVESGGNGKFVVQIVGDGTFLFSVPGSVYWIARRYKIPVLTIILNNKGWNAPRKSMLLVHPDGLGSTATNEEINISFDPLPDYAGIAKAAAGGDLFAARVEKTDTLEATVKEAIEAVQGGQSAVLDCKVTFGC